MGNYREMKEKCKENFHVENFHVEWKEAGLFFHVESRQICIFQEAGLYVKQSYDVLRGTAKLEKLKILLWVMYLNRAKKY